MIKRAFLAMTLIGPSAMAQAGGPDGKALVDQHCQGCHGAEIYTRADRKIQSPHDLRAQVQRCEQALNLTWFDEDVASVTAYLNQRFYQFK